MLLQCNTFVNKVLQEVKKSDTLSLYGDITEVPAVAWSSMLHDLLPLLLTHKTAEGDILVLQWKFRKAREVGCSRYLGSRENRLAIGAVLSDYFLGTLDTNAGEGILYIIYSHLTSSLCRQQHT